MDDNPNKRSGCAPIAFGTVAGLFLAVVLYVLSVGPAYRMTFADRTMNADTFDTIYMPLIYLADHSKPLGRLFKFYVVFMAAADE